MASLFFVCKYCVLTSWIYTLWLAIFRLKEGFFMFNNNFYGSQQIIRVNGENGAKMMNLQPNSSCMVLDTTAPLVWLIETDGAGYKTVTPYEIKPYQPTPEPTITDVIERLNKLEEKINAKSNTKQAKPEQ